MTRVRIDRTKLVDSFRSYKAVEGAGYVDLARIPDFIELEAEIVDNSFSSVMHLAIEAKKQQEKKEECCCHNDSRFCKVHPQKPIEKLIIPYDKDHARRLVHNKINELCDEVNNLGGLHDEVDELRKKLNALNK